MRRVVILIALCISAAIAISFGTPGIRSMVVGDKVLEVADTNQITFAPDGEVLDLSVSPDGKYVAYMAGRYDDPTRACLIRSSGGRSTVLVNDEGPAGDSTDGRYYEQLVASRGEAWCLDMYGLSWSPDSKLVLVPAEHLTRQADGMKNDRMILMFSTTGARQASLTLPEGSDICGNAAWNPTSTSIALVSYKRHSLDDPSSYSVIVFDIHSKSSRTVCSLDGLVDVVGWTSDGDGILCSTAQRDEPRQLLELHLSGKPVRTINEDYSRVRYPSPNGRFCLAGRPGIAIEDTTTGAVKQVISDPSTSFLTWSADSTILAYGHDEDVSDDNAARTTPVSSLWLASTETHKLNHMLVASEVESEPSLSRNASVVAYLYHNHLYAAEG